MYAERFISCLYRKESIKIGPPLVISTNALKEGLDIINEAIREVFIKTNK